MTVRAYPAYRESGVEWLGRVPAHWPAHRLGSYLAERREKVSDRDFAPLSVTKAGIVPQLDTAAKTDDGDNRKLVRKGDFAINGRSDRKGSSGLSSLNGSVSLINIVLSAVQPVDMCFVQYLLKSALFQEEFYRFGKGIVADLWSTNYSEMRNIELAVPPSDEQSAIAVFLDRETRKIDTLVAEQERLIALLKEKCQVVISHAVTKGLNPDVLMKNSGVPWLGELPEHWPIGRCSYYFDISPGFAFASGSFSQNDADTRLMRGTNVGVSVIRWDDVVYWRRTPNDKLDDYELFEGDLVLGMDRPWISAGVRVAKVTAADVPSLLLQRVARISALGQVSIDILELMLSSEFFTAHFGPEMTGVSVPHISPDQIGDFKIPVPPESEQAGIVAYTREIRQRTDRLVAEVTRAITLLRERRAALISAAVTGKIDVRDTVPATQGAA